MSPIKFMENQTGNLKSMVILLLGLVVLTAAGIFVVYDRLVGESIFVDKWSRDEKKDAVFGVLNFGSIRDRLNEIDSLVKPIKTVTNQPVVLPSPPPLKKTEEDSTPQMITGEGIIIWTNIERENYGQPAFKANNLLSIVAANKLEDMFARQYFSHLSPTGEGIGEMAERFNYRYAVIAENLALGNFVNEAELVKAWLASPGHRANILNNTLTQIGAASRIGNYQGQVTLIAVQVFAKPLAVCQMVNSALIDQIDQNKINIEKLYNLILAESTRIENTSYQSTKEQRKDIETYNDLVKSYNNLVTVTEASIAAYNQEVDNYNRCVSS